MDKAIARQPAGPNLGHWRTFTVQWLGQSLVDPVNGYRLPEDNFFEFNEDMGEKGIRQAPRIDNGDPK